MTPGEEAKNSNNINYNAPAAFPPIPVSARIAAESDRINGESQSPQATLHWKKENIITSIGVIDEHSFTRECIANLLQELDSRLKITSFVSCKDFLESNHHHDIILYHIRQRTISHDHDSQSFQQIRALSQISLVIILSSVECRDFMTQAFASGASGFVLTANTTPNQVVGIIHLIKVGGTFAPSSLSLQGTNGSALPPALTTQQFTPRELAIIERLRLGKANKIIAHELQMSESTVKVHIKSIMTKLKATNRTEIVCRAYDLGSIEAPSRPEA